MNDILEEASYKDINYYSWGEDDELNLTRRSGVRHLGRGHRLTIVDDYVFWTTWTDCLKEMVDCHEGTRLSLAWVEEFQLLTEGLAELGVYSAYLTAERQTLELVLATASVALQKAEDELRQELEDSPPLEPYQAFATSIGLDEKGYFMGVVLAHADSETARKNETLLEQRLYDTSSLYTGEPWADRIESMDIKSRGRITVAKLYGDITESWLEFVNQRDPLLLHK